MFPALIVTGAGMGLSLSQTYTDGTAQARKTGADAPSAPLDTVRQIGGAIGMAAIGTVVAAWSGCARSTSPPAPRRRDRPAGRWKVSWKRRSMAGRRPCRRCWTSGRRFASALRLSAARSIGDGYYVSAGMVALGLLATVVLMRRHPSAPDLVRGVR